MFFSLPPALLAANPLTITCEPSHNLCSTAGSSPIFSETNIYPGYVQSSPSRVSLVNLDPVTSCLVGLSASNLSKSDQLARELIISVGTPQNWVFKGPLSSLLSNPSPSLGTLPPNTSVDYSFLSSLPLTAGNQFQGKTLKLNIEFTFTCNPLAKSEGKVLGQNVTKTPVYSWIFSLLLIALIFFLLIKRRRRRNPSKG
ncbi:MAG: hypothetical protein WCT01_03785 [Candidatus Shapirobacteria bacterium]